MATQVGPRARLSRDRSVTALRIREQAEEAEDRQLAPQATRSTAAVRDHEEDPCPTRMAFQVDRDRIVHSKAFRRTKHKTQVFLAPVGDHYRTRLTHILEVNQIARAMARALRVNEDLVEAMALGHDIGHTPFGHVGEELLGEFMPEGFRHNEQSVRIVETLEKDGKGLNISAQARDGMLKHSATREGLQSEGWGKPQTIEGELVRFADKISYLNHDVDDALRAGLIAETDIPSDIREALGQTRADRLDTMVYDIIVSSYGKDHISMSAEVLDASNAFRNYMFENVYLTGPAKTEDAKAQGVLRSLLEHFEAHPDRMPLEHQRIAEREGVKRAVADYIAGMTDRYALDTYASVFIPSAWSHV